MFCKLNKSILKNSVLLELCDLKVNNNIQFCHFDNTIYVWSLESVELPHLPVGSSAGVTVDPVKSLVLESNIKYTDMTHSPPHTAGLLSGHGELQWESSILNEWSGISFSQWQ